MSISDHLMNITFTPPPFPSATLISVNRYQILAERINALQLICTCQMGIFVFFLVIKAFQVFRMTWLLIYHLGEKENYLRAA